ncbi:MAG: GyrI-like domain-containing protein [Labilithrix sp.]|nr:GyrI-like domain-containing protein [Labilithrix sp.]
MNATQLDLADDLVIVGIALRTSPESAATDIPAFWQRFLREDVATRIPAKRDGSVYAVYCDYESDHRGPYTMVLGVRTPEAAEIPAGMRRVRVPAGKYTSFVVKGDPAEVVWRTWNHVNTEWTDRHRRRYLADYERYETNASASSAEVDVVVGIV